MPEPIIFPPIAFNQAETCLLLETLETDIEVCEKEIKSIKDDESPEWYEDRLMAARALHKRVNQF